MKPHYYLVVSTGIIHGIYGSAIKHMAEERAESIPFAYVVRTLEPVSYTHLTLPTNREV